MGVSAYRRIGVSACRRVGVSACRAALEDEDDDEDEAAGERLEVGPDARLLLGSAMADQIFVTRKMVRADVAVAMETETESFVDGAERFAISFTVQTQIRAT